MNIATTLEALARKALVNALCPNCRRPFGPGLELQRAESAGPPQVRCPHCGVTSAERMLSMTPGATGAGLTGSWEDRNNPTGPEPRPDGTPITLETLLNGGVRITIPPRRAAGALTRIALPALIGLSMLTVFFAQGPTPATTRLGGPQLALTLLVVGGLGWAAWRAWRQDRRSAGTALRLELNPRALTLQWTRPDGSLHHDSLPIESVTRIRRRRLNRRTGTRGDRYAIAVIEIGLHPDCDARDPVFGHGLSAAEQRWIVWTLRQALTELTATG